MSNINNTLPVNKDDETLDYTQVMRRKLIDDMTKGNKMPEDTKDRMTFLAALDGMDRNALGKKKIKVDDKQATANSDTAAIIAEIYKKLGPKSLDNFSEENIIPQLPSGIEEPAIDDGEMVIGTQSDGYEEFSAKMSGQDISLDDNFDPEKR